MIAHRADQGAGQFFTGGVAQGVQNARKTMAPFARKSQTMRITWLFIKIDAPVQQFQHPPRALLNHHLHGGKTVQPRPAGQCVADMQLQTVFRLQNRSNAPLGVPSVGFVDDILGQDQRFAAAISGGNGCPQTRDTATNDQHISKLLRQAGGLERGEIAAFGQKLKHGQIS